MDRARTRRLRAMVDHHADFVGRLLRNLGVPGGELDDGVQQVYIVAASKLDEIRPESERAFLAQTSVNIAARARRARARSREVLDDGDEERLDLDGATPEEIAEKNRALLRLDQALAGMSLELRSVFTLHEIEEMTMAEIASTLSLPPGTVASRLRRAREEFRDRVRAMSADPWSQEERR